MKRSPNRVDSHVGSRVRKRRLMLNMSQEKLGGALRLTSHQVQKYENGTNRIGASRLQHISEILQVPIAYFFDGAPDQHSQRNGPRSRSTPKYMSTFVTTSDGLALAKAFMRINERKVRRSIVVLVKTIAGIDD
jgi:transcriptional regulator with XRE-family HTH domain